MKKIDTLLDGTTIINFPVYFRLLKRYKRFSAIIFVCVLLFGIILNFYQKSIYYTSITFSDVASGNTDPSLKMLSAFMGESKDNQKAYQIIALRKSMDFTRKVTGKIMANPDFNRMRFDLNFFGNDSLKATSIVKKCGGRTQCILEQLTELLPSFYEIFDRDRTGVTFTLEVKASDELTAHVLIKELQDSIQEARVATLRATIAQQEKTNIEILAIKEKDLEESEFYKHLEQKEMIDSTLKEVDDKLDVHGKIFAEVKSTLASLESRVERSKAVVGKKIGLEQIEKEKRRAELKERIEKLNKDLNALEISNFEYTEKDKQVIDNLKTELVEKKKALQKLGQGNASSSLDSFIKTSEEKLNATELEYRVTKDQYESLKAGYEQLLAEKTGIMEKKAKSDQTIERLAPTAKFVKEIKAKVDQLNLMKTTVVSDMRFDIYPKPPEETKKIGKILIAAYVIVLYVLLNLLVMTVVYLFDDKIHDEDDLSSIDESLKVIGVVPKYD